MNFAIVFPGQGSQSIGMLAELNGERGEVAQTFTEASDALGFDLWTLCAEGPESELNSTEITQPAMLTAGVAVWRVWAALGGPTPNVMAGHSLGEYAALVAAGSVAFADAARLVNLRGKHMQAAVPHGEGAVAAVLGLDDDGVRAACEAAADGEVVRPVNFNAPGQVVIAGHIGAVRRTIEHAKSAGAKRAIELPLSVPVHSPLMEPASTAYAQDLAAVSFGAPEVPIIHNADLSEHDEADAIRTVLTRQLYGPVRWGQTVEMLRDRGVAHVVELGPGKVLAGLNRRIDRKMGVSAAFDVAGIEQAIAAVSEG